jgi:4-hydroxybenzoate polyprenyltransferase
MYSAFEIVYGNQDTEEDIRLGLYSLSIFLGPTKSYFCVLACLVGFVWQFASILYRANLVLATPIVVLVSSLLSLETSRLDMTTPASCGGWAKRGVQIKILLCIALPASLVATFLQG